MKPPPIDRALVERMARLASLDLTEDECDALTGDLERIVAYVAAIDALEPEGGRAEPPAEPSPLRQDEPGASIARDALLDAAPEAGEGGFSVPEFMGGS